MFTIIVEILLAVFWAIMLVIIIHENKGNGDEGGGSCWSVDNDWNLCSFGNNFFIKNT